MPSKSSETSNAKNSTVQKSSQQNGRPNVGMRIKFYETSDSKDDRTHFNGGTVTQQQSFLLNLQQRQTKTTDPITEPVYAEVRKKNKKPKTSSERARKLSLSRERVLEGSDIYEDLQEQVRLLQINENTQENVATETRKRSRRKENTAQAPKEERQRNGTYFAVSGEGPLEKTDLLPVQNSQLPISPGSPSENNKISFLSAAEIEEIYQNTQKVLSSREKRPERSTDRNDKNLNSLRSYPMVEKAAHHIEAEGGPKDYQWKIVESKQALKELRKSLSNEDGSQFINLGAVKEEITEESRLPVKKVRQRRSKRSSDEKTEMATKSLEKGILNKISNEEFVHEPASKDDIIAVASNYFTGKTQGTTSKLILPARNITPEEKDTSSTKNESLSQISSTKIRSRRGEASVKESDKKKITAKSPDKQDELQLPTKKRPLKNPDRNASKLDHNLMTTSSARDHRSERLSEHTALTKQDSNSSVLSDVSGSSALSKKLLSLSQDGKTQQESLRRSKNISVKRLSQKKSTGIEDSEPRNNLSPEFKTMPEDRQKGDKKRLTISAIEYTLADVSPASVRSNKSLTLPHLRPGEKSYNESAAQNPPQSLTPEEYKSDQSRDRSPSSGRTQTSSSQNSLMAGDAQLVFRVDLDKPYHGRGIDETRTRENGQASVNEIRESKTKSKDEKQPNKWIQTDGPPIRAAKSTTFGTQTGINPCISASKKLQTRPWNLPEHLSNNVSQTTTKTTAEIATQTEDAEQKSHSSQTRIKKFQNLMTQTPLLPMMQEIGVQVSPGTRTTEAQTPDEDSDVWGTGNGVSLDRLIWNGAIKRSQSMGHAITGSPEKVRDRSASIDVLSTQNKARQKKEIQLDGTKTTGKITTYSWNENGKFVKIFVSYSGIHLLPSKNIQVKTNGINLLLTVEEPISENEEQVIDSTATPSENLNSLTSSLYLNRLRRPVACLSYNVQRDMITIMLRKQKQTPWNSLVFGGKIV